MCALSRRLEIVQEKITRAAERAGRATGDIRLVAVCKTFPPELVLEAVRAGLTRFGENRIQEAAKKIPQVAARADGPLEWHLVGRLQRNKARRALELFDVIESLDRLELATALERAAADAGRRLPVLVQVNIDAETQKGGVAPAELPGFLESLAALPHLEPRGLMVLPRACSDPEEVRPSFARVRRLREELNRGRPSEARLVELSMGMSADFEVAIEEGATLVRVGSAIFGGRSST